MSESQEARPPDPYKTLELHPHAPRDLVVAAYWALIERAKGRRAASGATGGAIGELNAAYQLLADDDARAAYDEAHGLPAARRPEVRVAAKGIRLFGIGAPARMVSDHHDFYHLLRIDRAAGADVVDAAFAVMSGQAVGRDAGDIFLRGLLEEARHTLRNPQLRAQYDASLVVQTRKAAPPPVAAKPSVALPTTYNLQPTTYPARPAPNGNGHRAAPPAIDRDLGAVAAAPPPAVAEEPSVAALAPAAATLPTTYNREPTTSAAAADDTPASAPSEMEQPFPEATTAPDQPRARGVLDRLRMPARASRAPTTYNPQPTTAPEPRTAPRLTTAEIIDAEHARLMTLREDHAPTASHQSPITSHESQAPAAVILAELVFLEGPRTGERVPLGADAVNLGSSYASHVVLLGDEEHIAPEHARIWLHGNHFVFRQLDDGDTTIAGQPLTLPMVVLDDGDEIRISIHRMRLEHAAGR
jgi:curved DNA-binding protein CbpA